MDFPSVKIIKVGTICHEASEIASAFNLQIKSDLGIGGGSTVTMIEAEKRILVDTGFDYEWIDTPDNRKSNARNLRYALRDAGITADDVDIVFITHWHKDHFGNLGIFKKAHFLASGLAVDRFKMAEFTGLNDGDEIVEGIKVIITPGHTAEHASLIIDSRLGGIKARIAIAGDAIISQSYFQSGRVWRGNADFHSVQKAQESTEKLVKASDLIVPGHGVPFLTR
jgi:glyoxylase-like metal-dependent hydrolase (beta-lactamase superfamily II)